jgi:hypothetical protein
MKYTQTVDNIVNSVAHVLTQATQACLQYTVDHSHLPAPTTQEEADNLGKQLLPQIALAAITKATTDPNGLLYENEIIPFMELLMNNATSATNNLINNTIQCIIELRPEGTLPPSMSMPTPEDEDPIIRAKQGKSKIIIPGIND